MERVFNFGPGPAMMPESVLKKAREGLQDFAGLGASVIEVSHRSDEFKALLQETNQLIRSLANINDDYAIGYSHGGARIQFAAIPMNFMSLKPGRKACYIDTGTFAHAAAQEAQKYGTAEITASSQNTGYNQIPNVTAKTIWPQEASYAHITLNNTVYGTQWAQIPDSYGLPLVADATSELLSRRLDFTKFAMVYAGLQKNLGTSGMAIFIVKKDLLGHAIAETPGLLDFDAIIRQDSLGNTINTFAIFVLNLMLKWMRDQGGLEALESQNKKKAQLLYQAIDQLDFYKGYTEPSSRSLMNATFTLAKPELEDAFINQALSTGLYALRGHRNLGGIRASIYNAMPLEGVERLVEFMEIFAKQHS